MTSPVVLRARIETLYMAMTDAGTPRGALTWFADTIGVRRKAVWSWCQSDRNPKKPILMVLGYLERDAGDRLEQAQQRRQEYYSAKLEEAGTDVG